MLYLVLGFLIIAIALVFLEAVSELENAAEMQGLLVPKICSDCLKYLCKKYKVMEPALLINTDYGTMHQMCTFCNHVKDVRVINPECFRVRKGKDSEEHPDESEISSSRTYADFLDTVSPFKKRE